MTSSKKWLPQMDFQESNKTILEFLIDCRKKNVLIETEPFLYQAYLVESIRNLEIGTPISEFMIFSKRHGPDIDIARSAVLKLLSVATKAHFFCCPEQKVRHEPYIFFSPNLKNTRTLSYGIIYPLEQKDIVVADWDLKYSASDELTYKDAFRFPVVLSKDPYKWLTKKKWQELKEAIKINPQDIFKHKSKIDAIQEVDKFTYGQILDYPFDMKQELYLSGAIFAQGIKKWFLLDGFDTEVITEYLDSVKNTRVIKAEKSKD